MAAEKADEAKQTQVGGVIGNTIKEGEGGIKKALEEGKGWNHEDILAYAKTIDDNHPMFAESLEVSGSLSLSLYITVAWFDEGLLGDCMDGWGDAR